MSDEEHEMPGFIVNMAELMQQHQQQHDHLEMSVDDAQHRLQTFFNEANREGLEALQTLLRVMIHADEPRMLAAYYDGIVATLLATKHTICVACGQNHDEVLAAVAAQQQGDPSDG